MEVSFFSSRIGRWQYVLELFTAGNILALVLALAQAQSWSNLSFSSLMQHILFINWILLSFAAIVEYFDQRLSPLNLKLTLLLGFLLLQLIVLCTTLVLNILMYFGQSFSFAGLSWETVFSRAGMNLSFGMLLGAFCFRYLYLREQWSRQQNSELNARIQAMQARIHPHFLFNSLNSAISLISIDPDKAEEMLLNLSRLFRASFQELKLVSLQEEIELAKRYLDIEQLRFGPRMQVRWNIDPEVLSLPVPPLVLQPLVENAVKHGVEPSETPAHIRISLHRHGKNYATLTVTNTQAGPSAPGLGMALANVRHRLQLLYDMDFQMEQRHKAHAFQVQLRLPFNRTPAVPTAHAHPDH